MHVMSWMEFSSQNPEMVMLWELQVGAGPEPVKRGTVFWRADDGRIYGRPSGTVDAFVFVNGRWENMYSRNAVWF